MQRQALKMAEANPDIAEHFDDLFDPKIFEEHPYWRRKNPIYGNHRHRGHPEGRQQHKPRRPYRYRSPKKR